LNTAALFNVIIVAHPQTPTSANLTYKHPINGLYYREQCKNNTAV